jgi:hypothetical protein
MRLSLEEKILNTCIKPSFVKKDIIGIKKTVSKEVDWNVVIELTSQCGIAPIIARNLLKINDYLIPKEILEARFKDYQTAYVVNNMILWNAFLEVLELANKNQIQIIPIKGVIFNQLVYENAGLRHTTDIDALVNKEDLPTWESCLKCLGYILEEPTDENKDVHLSNGMHFKFKKNNLLGGEIILELHWDVLPSFMQIKGIAEDFWSNTNTITIGDTNILSLSPEDMLFETIIELYKDMIMEKRPFLAKRHLDIYQITQRYSNKIQWHSFIKKAYQYKINNLAYYALDYNKKFLNNNFIAEETLSELKPLFITRKLISKINFPLFKRYVGSENILSNFFIAEVILLGRFKVFLLQLFYLEFPEIDFYKGTERLIYVFTCIASFIRRQIKRLS